MSPEDAMMLAAWAVLFVVLVCLTLRALAPLARRAEPEAPAWDEAVFDHGGPVIDAEPAR